MHFSPERVKIDEELHENLLKSLSEEVITLIWRYKWTLLFELTQWGDKINSLPDDQKG